MPGLLQAIRTRPTITPEFRHAFDHQVMLTEQLRIKVLLVTLATLVGFLTIARLVAPTRSTGSGTDDSSYGRAM